MCKSFRLPLDGKKKSEKLDKLFSRSFLYSNYFREKTAKIFNQKKEGNGKCKCKWGEK